MSDGKLTVFVPTADDQVGQDDLASRSGTLDGKVVGLLNNTKDRTGVIFDQLERHLKQQFPDIQIRHYRKPSVSGMPPGIRDQLVDEVDALITATAD